MKKLLKITGILVLLVILLVGAAVGWVFYNIDSLAKDQIESGGTRALGVATKVDSVGVHPFAGELAIHGLDIANPEGFAKTHFLAMKKGEVEINLRSLDQDVIMIPKLRLSGIDVVLQRKDGTGNYQKILDNIAKLKGNSSPPPPGSKEKRFVIHELTIEGVKIHADMIGMSGPVGEVLNPTGKFDIPLERIELTDVGRTGTGVAGTGVTTKELTAIVVQAVMAAAADKGTGILPVDILNDIKSRVGSIGGLAEIPVVVVGRVGEAATQLGGKVLEGAADAAGKAIKGAADAIGDGIDSLLGGKKPEPKPDPKKDPKKP